MADYYTQTVVHQTIPITDVTPLERLLLSHIFETEPDAEGLYLFSEQGPSDMLWLARDEVEVALAASESMESAANAFVREQLSKLQADATEVELDMSEPGWPFLFQDIVRRSPTLQYVSVEAAFTCSKMRSDGFGGMAILITADEVFSKTTGELLQEFEDKATGNPDVAPDPGGSRVLCELRYPAIRNLIAGFAVRDPAFTTVSADAVTMDDIAQAIGEAIGMESFTAMQTELEGHVAARAVRAAEKRLGCPNSVPPADDSA
jgi:hypothetical protein